LCLLHGMGDIIENSLGINRRAVYYIREYFARNKARVIEAYHCHLSTSKSCRGVQFINQAGRNLERRESRVQLNQSWRRHSIDLSVKIHQSEAS
jgi:site-specific recombinase XerD